MFVFLFQSPSADPVFFLKGVAQSWTRSSTEPCESWILFSVWIYGQMEAHKVQP